MAQNYGGQNNAGAADEGGSGAAVPLQFVLFDSTVAGSPGRYLPLFGESSDKPVAGHFTTEVPVRGIPTNTPRTPSCNVRIYNPSQTYRGPSLDDLPNGSVSANQTVNLSAYAVDEANNKWYGFNDASRSGIPTWIPLISAGASVINEWEIRNCSLANKNTPSDPGPWNAVIGGQSPAYLPMQPVNLSTPVTGSSFRAFGIVDTGSYSSITGCRHPGFDFKSAQNSDVYAMYDGIVVGMGVGGTSTRPALWGSADTGQYNLVIRTGSHFVLYGHLKDIDVALYYGKTVLAGTKIGSIAYQVDGSQADNSHLHLEILSFSRIADANSGLLPKFGAIKRNGTASANRVVDPALFTSQSGTVVFTSNPISDCAFNGVGATPAPQIRYQGGVFLPNSGGNATLVYAVRSTESRMCFDKIFDKVVYSPTTCYSQAANTPSAVVATPTPKYIPTPTP